MRKQIQLFFLASLFCAVCSVIPGICKADTFKHKVSGQTYHGYAEQDAVAGKTTLHTAESGPVQVNLTEYNVTRDNQGRNKHVVVFTFDDAIESEIVTAAFEKAIVEESNKGPLLIILEIDSPGGRVDLAMRLCSAITKTRNCTTAAFIRGGKHSGAYSAAAAIALACNKIYMSGATVMGAATVVATSETGIVELEKMVGNNVGEKIRSAWRNYLASLAEQNNRPVALARAMENKDIEVLRIRRNGKITYIDSTEKQGTDEIISIYNRKGQLVTLPAQEAVNCFMADKVVSSIEEVLADADASDAAVQRPEQMVKAQEELEKINRKFNQLKNSFDTKVKTLIAKNRSRGMTLVEAKKSFRGIIQEVKYLIKLKQSYPDVPCQEEELQDLLNTLQAEYDSL
ncbi:MAG: hypothetical protein JXB18_07690 [Sedimentisphaerales bacterium]|nr:hypothetical protein [Sedimentisphaerales bacterium]